jgi:transcriptional antiterminator RfaH
MLQWYVVHSKPQKEFFVEKQLILRKLEVYCPTVQVQSINPRVHKIQPYFRGYLFSRIDLSSVNLSILNWLPGAIGLVSFGGQPACIPDNLLTAIRSRLDQINAEHRKPLLGSFQPGDEVTIQEGPFAGYEAIFCAEHGESERVQVLLRLLRDHTVRVDLPLSQIKATKQNRP